MSLRRVSVMPPNRSERRPYPIRRYSGGILTFLAVTTALAAAPPQAARSQSESPRKHLAEYVAELQKDPSDDVLREKIIKLALTLQPKPAVPSEADELAGR